MNSVIARCLCAIVPDAHVLVECVLSISADVLRKSGCMSALEIAGDAFPRKELQRSAEMSLGVPQSNDIVIGPISGGGTDVPFRTEV